MKINLCILILFFSGLFLANAEMIKTNDGTVYPDAKVFDTQANGITISFEQDGYNTLKFINFNDLPKNLQEKFGYNKAAANKFDQEHNRWVAQQNKLHSDEEKFNQDKEQAMIKIQQDVQASSRPIQFESIDIIKEGTVGRAWSADPEANESQQDSYMGYILLYGSEFTDGYEWAGNVCPLNDTVQYKVDNHYESIPCYAIEKVAVEIKLIKLEAELKQKQ